MAVSLQGQIEKLHLSIKGLEAQRSILGDEIVNPALDALQKQLAELDEQVAAQAAPTEERRMVTILFIDIVGSTSIAERLDPEEWRQVVSSVHTILGNAVNTHHGSVAQYLGDGLLAFFGSKQAGEHDPENAIRSALAAQAGIANLPLPEKLQIRAGIHTGLVVVGELGDALHKEYTASGDAMNLAARLQSAAPPGGTLISHDTYRYVRGVFDMTPRPPLTVKGKSAPIQTYLVRRAKPRPFRIVSRGVAGVETRTVGRETEIETLQKAYLRAYEGKGTVWAQLLGEPGVGKSRLLMDLMDWLDLRDENFRLLRARAFPDDVNQPFALVRRMWFDRFQIAEDAPLEIAEAKWVERFKEFYGKNDYEEAAHALGLLVGLPFENSPYIKGMRNDPTHVKGRALVVSQDLVQTVRIDSPMVVLLEDLQWADQATWEYLREVFLEDATQLNGLFILGSARPEWHPPQELIDLFDTFKSTEAEGNKWGVLVNLVPLTDQSIHELVRELFQRAEQVPEQIIDLLVERSEGVPYFTEEMVNWFIDHEILDTQGDRWHFSPEKLKTQPLPATLQHLLLTRLSSLSQPERATLQYGAIFGRRFWTCGVEALGVREGTEILNHLQQRGFVDAQPESAFEGDTEWSFHHNLLHEVTYESVLKRERSKLHKEAAQWLEKQASQAGRLEEFGGLLGEHYKRAGELSTAVDWYLRAGKRAVNQGAPREAKGFYTQALELLPPIDQRRRWQALSGREEVLEILGEGELWKSDINTLLELARSFEDENYLAEAYLRWMISDMRAGKGLFTDQAIQEVLATIRRCKNEAIEAKVLAVIAVSYAAKSNETGTIQNIEPALQIARRLNDESVLSFVLSRAAFCFNELGDTNRGLQLQKEQIDLDHHLGNRWQEAIGIGNIGSRMIVLGMYKQARAMIERGVAIDEALGAHRTHAYNLMRLGNLYRFTGDLRKAYQMAELGYQEIIPTQDPRGKILALIVLGLILHEMGDSAGAFRRFDEAHQLALDKQLLPNICETATGLAACALSQGHYDQASKYVNEAWDLIKEHGMVGILYPGQIYRTIAETFEALGDTENARLVIESGYQALMEDASKINVPEWRQSYLENVPDNRALIDMWERIRH